MTIILKKCRNIVLAVYLDNRDLNLSKNKRNICFTKIF